VDNWQRSVPCPVSPRRLGSTSRRNVLPANPTRNWISRTWALIQVSPGNRSTGFAGSFFTRRQQNEWSGWRYGRSLSLARLDAESRLSVGRDTSWSWRDRY
jgi:hypothetical protein